MIAELLNLGPDILRLLLLILQIIEKHREAQQEQASQTSDHLQEYADDQKRMVDQLCAAGLNPDAINQLHELLGMLRRRQSELGEAAGDAGPDGGADSPGPEMLS
jgi:hypothetical protein